MLSDASRSTQRAPESKPGDHGTRGSKRRVSNKTREVALIRARRRPLRTGSSARRYTKKA
jgi:hypothetical protein